MPVSHENVQEQLQHIVRQERLTDNMQILQQLVEHAVVDSLGVRFEVNVTVERDRAGDHDFITITPQDLVRIDHGKVQAVARETQQALTTLGIPNVTIGEPNDQGEVTVTLPAGEFVKAVKQARQGTPETDTREAYDNVRRLTRERKEQGPFGGRTPGGRN